jgi:hypothetical protein
LTGESEYFSTVSQPGNFKSTVCNDRPTNAPDTATIGSETS